MIKWLNINNQNNVYSVKNTNNITVQDLSNMRSHINYIRDNLTSFYTHRRINDCVESDYDITIVMTASNRSKQTYKTLDTISNSKSKNIQVIVVDDSKDDKIDHNILKSYDFTIDFIQILQDKKCWYNPVINYNIGFQHIKGRYVVIQNAEVCHVGDVLDFIKNNLTINKYFVFDVRQSASYYTNNEIFKYKELDISIYNNQSLFEQSAWYQSANHNNRALHFLTATDIDTFKRIGGFSYDYTFGDSYDDDDFLLKIRKLGVDVISFDNRVSGCGGIHLYHTRPYDAWARNIPSNIEIFNAKLNIPEYVNFI